MKRVTAAIAIALSAFVISGMTFSPVEAQTTNLQFNRPLDYRFSVQPRSHVFSYNRQHRHHAWRHRHRTQFLPVLAGPAVIYQNGDIGIPQEEDRLSAAVPTTAQPVVYRLGERGGCGLQQLSVPGSKGQTTINVWRC